MNDSWLNKVNWAQDGLVPAVAQEAVLAVVQVVVPVAEWSLRCSCRSSPQLRHRLRRSRRSYP